MESLKPLHKPKVYCSPWIVTKPFSDSYRDHDHGIALETGPELDLSLGWLFVSFV